MNRSIMNRSILILLFILLTSTGCSRPNESFEKGVEEKIEKTIQENNSNGEIHALKDAQGLM